MLIVISGIITLPLVAAFLDGPSTQELIVPIQFVLAALVGAAVGHVLPGLTDAGSSRLPSAATGACIGLTAALVAVAVFFILL